MNRKVKKALKIVGITITGFIAAVVVSLGCLCIYHQCRLKKERSVDVITSQDREALAALNIEGPYILVPHSASGLEAVTGNSCWLIGNNCQMSVKS